MVEKTIPSACQRLLPSAGVATDLFLGFPCDTRARKDAGLVNEDVRRSIKMNLLILLILALPCLIGVVIINRALERTKNDSDNDALVRNRKTDGRNPRGVRTKVMIGRLRNS